MKFNPMSEKEISELGLWPDGEYVSEMIYASDEDRNGNKLLTKNGSDKIEIEIEITNSDGKKRKIKGNLNPDYMKVLSHFCKATDLIDKYKSGDLSVDDIAKVGKFITVLGKWTRKDSFGETITTNQIVDFKKFEDKKLSNDGFNDPIPF